MTSNKIIAGLEDAIAVAKGEASARVTIKQSRGPTLEFQGRLLAHTEWEARDGLMRLELWQTERGALIPVTRSRFDDEGRRALVSATVVEPYRLADQKVAVPGEVPQTDDALMRFAVMDHFDWTDRARSMVRDQLGWVLKRVVE